MAEEKKVEKVAAEKKAKSNKPSLFSRFAAWLRSVKAELKKIVWTSPKAVRSNTIMVLVVLLVFAAATGIVDTILTQFITILGLLIN